MARVTVVTPNPALDLTYLVDRQRIGETVRVRTVLQRPGGKGLNVARVLSILGIDVVAVQPLGGASGHWIERELADAGIATDTVVQTASTRSTVTVVDDVEQPTVLTEPGPPLDEDTWAQIHTRIVRNCGDGDVLVVSGSLPAGTAPGRVADMVAAGRSAGARVLVDVSGPGLLAAAGAGADLLKPNAAEAREATGAPDLDEALTALLALGARAVAVSRGHEGLTGADADGTHRTQPAVPGIEGNPTGAGDAATAGIVAAWAAGAPAEVALRWAALLGAAAVLRPSAGDIDLTDLAVLATRIPALPDVLQRFHLPL